MIRVAITDDHPLAINGLSNMLSAYSHIRITGSFGSGEELIEGLKTEQPDVLLLDIQLPDKNGTELAPLIHGLYPDIKILVITSLDAPSYVKTMLRSGCSGYILKNTSQKSLLCAIEEVYEGREYIEPTLKEQMLQQMLHYKKQLGSPATVLTRREKEILKLVVEEYSSQEIADKLFLSLRTVENHRFNILKKLNVNNPFALVKVAIQMGLVSG